MIEINNLTTVRVDEKRLKNIARKVLEGETPHLSLSRKMKGKEIKCGVELSIAFVKPARMQELNKRYRRKNKATDVLSFPAAAFGLGLQTGSPENTQGLRKIIGLGEIIICPQQVKKNAKRFGSNFEKELTRVLIHGILSLLGYHHKKGEAEEKEQYYLKILKS